MVDITELTDYIFTLVKKAGLTTYKYRFPNNQKGTFIVVTPLALVGRMDQSAVVNVNVYTDNLTLSLNGKNDQSQPNSSEIKRALNLVLPHIENNEWGNNTLVNIQQSTPIYEETQTFINLRINYRKLNYGNNRN